MFRTNAFSSTSTRKSVSKIAVVISLVFGLAACDNMSRDPGVASAPVASAASVPVAASQASAPVEAKAELDLNNFDITEHLGDREMGFKVAQLCKQEGPDNATGEYRSKACNEIFNDLNSPCNLDSTSHNPFCDAINEDTENGMREHNIDQEMKRANTAAEILNHPTATEAQGIVLGERCYNSNYAGNQCRAELRRCASNLLETDDKCRGLDAFLQSKGTGVLQIAANLPKEAPKPAGWHGFASPKAAAIACDGADTPKCDRVFNFCDAHPNDSGCREYQRHFGG
uniref:Uncharacterized protein n=1 Tax=Myoviridae sp. ctLnO19 TaxID=2825085 RepID=A0A8S5P0Y9_9CAUD|nr:MAG TPA: hypothetical protein [Myoviridae sp. ctLnO19]DAJ69116.1 MAG TPA: hypothetical protein [Caudoviricetes sp.]